MTTESVQLYLVRARIVNKSIVSAARRKLAQFGFLFRRLMILAQLVYMCNGGVDIYVQQGTASAASYCRNSVSLSDYFICSYYNICLACIRNNVVCLLYKSSLQYVVHFCH